MAFLGTFLQLELREDVERIGLGRADDERRHRGLPPGRQAVADPLLRPDERERVDERVGHGRGRVALLAVEIELLDPVGLGLPAVPADERVVEVLPLRAHSADVERDVRLQRVAKRRDVVAHEDAHSRRDLEALPRAPDARPERRVEALGIDEDREPAVRDLGCERNVPGADRREVDRHLGAQRPQHELQRLPEPRRPGAVVGDAVVLALMCDDLAPEGRTHDVDVLPSLPERLSPGFAVPALHHLRPRRAEAEDEAAARHQVERCGGHRGVCRCAARDLHDRRAHLDPRRRGGEPGEHGDGVGPPRLRRPGRVVAERLGALHERYELRRVRPRWRVADVHAQLHSSILCRYRRRAVTHPELTAEQAYVDHAYECLDRMRSTLERTGDSMATEFAAIAMEAWVKRRVRTFQDADRGLCFGRLTLDAGLRPLYVGRRWVHDDQHEMLVVNWQAPAARPFYTATPNDPQRVTQRRRYRTEGRRIIDISDESLDGTGVEGASVSDFLLEELGRRREGRMRDIVATIQSDQYRLITAEPDGALVVQGGPGTGKTAVGLHRASWLLYTHREQLRRVLVVGPNPTFMDYVSHVLPTLGEEAVEQRAVTELVDGVAA